ncbi:hypothetical protein BHU11_06885 [Tannerella sp. oral taxon 808]|nr:hypothetical protein BHU11_06885 [Tannerella sp. oral taxon 808]
MKASLLTLLLGLLALTATGCNRSNAQGAAATDAAELSWSETDIVAVAFVGYYATEADFRATPAYADLCKRYALPDDVPFIDHAGDEVYLVIPRDPNASVAVNNVPAESLTDPDVDAHGPILYKSEEGTPFFIKCQSSGGMTNAEIIIVDNNKHELTYRPQLSTDDGSLMTPGMVGPGEGSVLDITQPLPTSSLPRSVDRPGDNLRAEIRNGRPIVIVKQAVQALDDGPHPVEHISGRCVGLHLALIEGTPYLFMLMDDGGVEAISYRSIEGFGPLTPGNFISSGRLPDLKGITGFRQEGSALFAVDKSGSKHEIHPCLLPESYRVLYHYADGKEYQLLIYPDWKLEYIGGWPESEVFERYFGHIRPIKMDPKGGIFEFRYVMFTHTTYSGDMGESDYAKTSPSDATGTFRLITRDGGKTYDLTLLTGPDLFGITRGTPAHYEQTRRGANGKALYEDE